MCFVGVLVLHAIATRLPPARQTVSKLIVIGGVVGLGLAAWLVSEYSLSIVTWAGLLLFGLLCELYVFCFTLTMNSVSSRLLILFSPARAIWQRLRFTPTATRWCRGGWRRWSRTASWRLARAVRASPRKGGGR